MAGFDTDTLKLNVAQVAYHDHLGADAYAPQVADGGPVKSHTIRIGQISSLTEPSGWVEGEPVPRLGVIEYHPKSDDRVQLYTYDRGQRLGPDNAKSLADVLYTYGPHTLKADELASLQEHGILRDKGSSSDFVPLLAKTEDVNGRRVLVVEGTFKGQNLHARTMYVDADVKRDGSVIQELTYEAPGSAYYKHLPEARKAMQSVAWK